MNRAFVILRANQILPYNMFANKEMYLFDNVNIKINIRNVMYRINLIYFTPSISII